MTARATRSPTTRSRSTRDISVNGTADAYGTSRSSGNFNQLKELKAKYPNLKIVLSLGGWTYSKYFSDVAATAASRQKFVSLLHRHVHQGQHPGSQGGYGGTGTAAGIFDGFDIDWEYPASHRRPPGQPHSAADKRELHRAAAGVPHRAEHRGLGQRQDYALSAALPSGQDKIANDPDQQDRPVPDLRRRR